MMKSSGKQPMITNSRAFRTFGSASSAIFAVSVVAGLLAFAVNISCNAIFLSPFNPIIVSIQYKIRFLFDYNQVFFLHFCILVTYILFIFLKKNTIDEPRAVTIQVNMVAIKAPIIGFIFSNSDNIIINSTIIGYVNICI